MKNFILVAILFSALSQAEDTHKDLVPKHDFLNVHTYEQFTKWCYKNDLLLYSIYFKKHPEELANFLSGTQRVLHPVLKYSRQVDRAESVLKDALNSQNPVEAIRARMREDLKIYRPMQRSYYTYAKSGINGTHAPDFQGRVTRVIGNTSLPMDAVDVDYERAFMGKEIVAMDPSLEAFTPEEKAEIREWHSKYDKIIADHYSGRNALLKQIEVREIKRFPRPNRGTVDEFVQKFGFGDKDWWHISSTRVAGESTPATNIKGEWARSLLRRYGPKATRILHWPLENKEIKARPVLGVIHFAVNYDSKNRMRSLEVIVKDAQGKVHPFLYEKVRVGLTDSWLPIHSLAKSRIVPIEVTCLKCHGNDADEISFRPQFLTQDQDFRNVGYESQYIIDALLKL